MTRDEQRAACFKAMKVAFINPEWPGIPHLSNDEIFTIRISSAFDSLHGLARVNPIEATEEMLFAARNYFADGLGAYEAISAAGDLTNPPEKKP